MAGRLDATEENRRLLSDVAHELRTRCPSDRRVGGHRRRAHPGITSHDLLVQQAARLQRIANDLNASPTPKKAGSSSTVARCRSQNSSTRRWRRSGLVTPRRVSSSRRIRSAASSSPTNGWADHGEPARERSSAHPRRWDGQGRRAVSGGEVTISVTDTGDGLTAISSTGYSTGSPHRYLAGPWRRRLRHRPHDLPKPGAGARGSLTTTSPGRAADRPSSWSCPARRRRCPRCTIPKRADLRFCRGQLVGDWTVGLRRPRCWPSCRRPRGRGCGSGRRCVPGGW